MADDEEIEVLQQQNESLNTDKILQFQLKNSDCYLGRVGGKTQNLNTMNFNNSTLH